MSQDIVLTKSGSVERLVMLDWSGFMRTSLGGHAGVVLTIYEVVEGGRPAASSMHYVVPVKP
jgi:hypothetical protein